MSHANNAPSWRRLGGALVARDTGFLFADVHTERRSRLTLGRPIEKGMNMHTLNQPFFRTACAVAALAIASGGAFAAGAVPGANDAQERYRQEMAVCNSGQSHQDPKTCRIEARNALADARRGGLSDAAPDQYSRNAVQRCGEFKGDERTACEARVFNPSRVDGSVQGGGLVRESVIVVPAR